MVYSPTQVGAIAEGDRLETVSLDGTDRLLVAALQLDARASWQHIADATGIPLSTVARRAGRLLDANIVRVVGFVDVQRGGLGVPVLARVRCVPGKTESVAEALAALAETRLVLIVTGGTDVVVELVCPDMTSMRALLATSLPSTPGIAATETAPVLQIFSAVPRWGRLLLAEESAEVLDTDGEAAAVVRPPAEPIALDELDHALIAALFDNGRLGYKELAATVGSSQSTVARRLGALQRSRVLHFRTVVDPDLVGLNASFLLWLAVDPTHIHEVGQRLAAHPSCGLWATAGRFNLVCLVVLPHHDALYPFTTDVLGSLPGIRDVDITTQLAALKRAWHPVGAAPNQSSRDGCAQPK